jgi:hypothetical protein
MTTTDDKKNCLIDSIHVGEATIDSLRPDEVVLSAKLAYVNAETGARLGFMNKRGWSDQTWTALRNLMASMEADALRDVFGEGATAGGQGGLMTTSDGIPGL